MNEQIVSNDVFTSDDISIEEVNMNTTEQDDENVQTTEGGVGPVNLVIDDPDSGQEDAVPTLKIANQPLTTVAQAIVKVFKEAGDIYCDEKHNIVHLSRDRYTGMMLAKLFDSAAKFAALVSQKMRVEILRKGEWQHAALPNANVILKRQEWSEHLNRLAKVSQTPVLDLVGMRIQPPGYDPNTYIYYDGPEITARDDAQTPHLDELLKGWTGLCGSDYRSCVSDADIAALYAAFFTEALADSGLFVLHMHPCIRGNQKGVGKDLLAQCLSQVRESEAPVTVTCNRQETRLNPSSTVRSLICPHLANGREIG